MKKKIIVALTLLSSVAIATPPVTTGLVAAWEFSGNFNDSWSTWNGTASNVSFTTDRCGNANSAASFNGFSSQILTSLMGPTGTGARSLSFWMKTTNSTSGSPRAIFNYGNSTGSGVGDAWQINHNYCAQGVGLDVSDQALITTGSCVNNNGWHHVVVIYSGSSAQYTSTVFYVDGILQSINCNVSGLTQTINTGNVFNVTMGRDAFSSGRYYDGVLDDVYFYNTALTSTDVQTLFQSGCGISSYPCFCNNQNTFNTPPLDGASYYSWTYPSGWTVSGPSGNSSIVFNASSGSGFVTCNIGTACGGVITRTVKYKYCNNNGTSLPITAPSVTLCTNASSTVMLTATTNISGATFTWVPGNVTGTNYVVSPTVTTVYTVTGYAPPDFCPTPFEVTVTVTQSCCPSFVQGTTTLLSGANISGSYVGGSYAIANNVSVLSGATFQNCEVMMYPGVQISVPATEVLNLNGAHLYACGAIMWQGIDVQDKGSLVAASSAGQSNLIEDAETAVNLANMSTAMVIPPLDLTDVTFNKNHIGIYIGQAQPGVTTVPIRLDGCVFTSRTLNFTSTLWPYSYVTDLRYAAPGATTDIAPPYTLLGNVPATTKVPYLGQPAAIGIKIENIANVQGVPTTAGVDIGVTYPTAVTSFNLFDNLGTGIEVTDASLSTANNVFQIMLLNSQYSTPGIGIHHVISSNPPMMNARLDLRSTIGNNTTDFGNRFWNCITGVQGTNTYEYFMDHGVFRSDQQWPVTGLVPGFEGIHIATNRFEDDIEFSEFNNLQYGIILANQSGLYDMGMGVSSGIYAGNITISQNYFGPQVTSSTPLLNNEFFGHAIKLSGPNMPIYQLAAVGDNATIVSNKCDRVFRGISLNSMYDYPVNILGNQIYAIDEVPSTGIQFAIYAFDNSGNLTIGENNAFSNNTMNPRMSLIRCKNNSGSYYSPIVRCNSTTNSYEGFQFDGNNQFTFWMGNSMKTHEHGMALVNSGVIGQQGSPSLASGNSWNGTWSGPGFETWCDNSDANLSPLYVLTTSPWNPINNSGVGTFTAYTPGGNLFPLRTNNYQCPGYTYPPIPSQRTAGPVGIANNTVEWTVEVYPNPTSGQLTIEGVGNSQVLHCRLIDITGKTVMNKDLNVHDAAVTLEISVKKGIYVLEITDNNNKTTRKKVVIE